MKILHTSDWHIGRSLFGRKRYAEFEAFLDWLADTIEREAVDALLIAGDVFDTSAPSHRSQALYYRFLCRVAASPCRHLVVIAGNHDSPSFLDAPRELLKALDVHVVGSTTDNLADEVLVLRDEQKQPELIVCAVPYLRDRDIRTAEAGESVEDKERKLIEGIRHHYAAVGALAEQQREQLEASAPIVGMGHLFAAGGRTLEGDGVRDLYVGSLAHVTAAIFPACFDYLALGHLHVPQKVGDTDSIRYSGSPLPMGFGEASQQKSVCVVTFEHQSPSIQLVDVPVFQKLERIKGDWERIEGRIRELATADACVWLEVIYEGEEIIGDLRERLEAATTDTALEILRIKNARIVDRVLSRNGIQESLDDLNEQDVFVRCLAAYEVPEEQRPALLQTYRETVSSLYEEDSQAQ